MVMRLISEADERNFKSFSCRFLRECDRPGADPSCPDLIPVSICHKNVVGLFDQFVPGVALQ